MESEKHVTFDIGILPEETVEQMVKLEIQDIQNPNEDEVGDEVGDEVKESMVEDEVDENAQYNIPNRIFQTHKSIQYIQLNPKIGSAINSWRRFVPTFGYHFYTNQMCDEFMRKEMIPIFGEIIYQIYQRLPLNVMRADLWRYCVIYKYGGIYSDADTICQCDPRIFTRYPTMLVCAPENNVHLCNWTFAAPAGSPILKQIIELSLERITAVRDFKGEHIVHFLTGPGVFTDGIEKYFSINDIDTFTNKLRYAVYKNPTIICFKHNIFHIRMVKHLFAGSDKNGWTNERDLLLLS